MSKICPSEFKSWWGYCWYVWVHCGHVTGTKWKSDSGVPASDKYHSELQNKSALRSPLTFSSRPHTVSHKAVSHISVISSIWGHTSLSCEWQGGSCYLSLLLTSPLRHITIQSSPASPLPPTTTWMNNTASSEMLRVPQPPTSSSGLPQNASLTNE